MGYFMRLKTLLLSFVISVIFINLVAIRMGFAQSNPLCLITLSEIRLAYDSNQDEFTGSITIGNDYFCVATMVIHLKGKDNLEIFTPPRTYSVSGDQVTFQFGGSLLQPEKEYVITAIPLNDASEIFTSDNEPVQREMPFTYTPKGPDPLTVKVNSVNPNYEKGTLIIDLDISDDRRIVSYEGFITDKDSGGTVHKIESELYKGLQIEEALATNNPIRTAQEPHEYQLTFCVYTKDDSQVCAEPYPFKPAPAPKTPWWRAALNALSNPVTAASVLIILMSAIGWVIVRNGPGTGDEPKLRRPPIEGTETINRRERYSAASGNGRAEGAITVRIVRAPGSANLKKQRISRDKLPFTIGRDGCSLNINDPHISKSHVEIREREGNYYLKDLGSINHTFVEEREIPANKLVALRDATLVRLGPNTEIEIEVNG